MMTDISKLVVITSGPFIGQVGVAKRRPGFQSVTVDLGGATIQKNEDQLRPFRLGETVTVHPQN